MTNASGRHASRLICVVILAAMLLSACAGNTENDSSNDSSPQEVSRPSQEQPQMAASPDAALEAEEKDVSMGSAETDAPEGSSQKESSGSKEEGPQPEKPEANEPEESPDVSEEPPTVTLTAWGTEDSPVILEKREVTWEQGDTVLGLLVRVTREERIHMAYRGGGRTGYVEGIDNLYEFDHGPASGWVYSINGVFPDRSAGGMSVSPGDDIVWWYTLDAGRDVGTVSP